MSMRKFAINGRIFEFPITGVGRFCVEVIKAIDASDRGNEFILLLPSDAQNVPSLKRIETEVVGNNTGIIWEQMSLPIYARKHRFTLLNMSNSIPLLKPDYVVIHDVSLKVNRKDFGTGIDKCRIWWPLLHYRVSALFAKHIFTVSEFQKQEIIRNYGVDSDKITAVYNGWEHMDYIEADWSVLDKYNLAPKEYYFAVSTLAKNKNFKWVLENAKYNIKYKYVISGKIETKYFSDGINVSDLDNVIYTGYVTDGELKALMAESKAFLYPSLYEGFGIPPLEAISVGTKAIVAQASCLPEIYGSCVYYIDPMDSKVDLEKLLTSRNLSGTKILDKYGWGNTAKSMLDKVL